MAEVPAPGGLLERETELARIAGRLAEARAGEGGLLVIEGPAGIGKTSLVRTVRATAAGQGMLVLHARAAELERAFAFGTLRQALERPLAELPEAERAAVLAGRAAHARRVLDADTAPGAAEAVLQGVLWLVANLAERRPLVLAVDDAHWADEPSVAGLAFLARRVDELPVALLLSTRPPDVDAQPALAALVTDPAADVLRPRPLGERAIAALAGSADPAFVRAAAEATGGNPFLLGQLLRELGDARDPAAVARVQPRDLARAVLARLGEPARALARALAVLGDPAGVGDCAALAQVDEPAAAVAELTAAGVLAEDVPLRFRHPLLRAAVQAGLPPGRHAAWHARAAAQLRTAGAGPERVAIHLLAMEPAVDGEVVDGLLAAAGAARARGAPSVAESLLRRALAEPPPPDRRAEVLLALGRVLTLRGASEAVAVLEEASRTAPGVVQRAEALEALTWALGPGQPHHVEALDAALAALPEDEPQVRLRLEAVRLAAASGDPAQRWAALERAQRLGLLDEDGPPVPDLLAHAARWHQQEGRPADECARFARRAVEAGRRLHGGTTDRLWLPFASIVLRTAEALGEARAVAEHAQEAARREGTVTWYAMGTVLRAQALRSAGELREAEADARMAADAVEAEHGWPAMLPASALCEVLLERGDVVGAARAFDRLGVTGAIPPGAPLTVLAFARGWLRFEQGDLRGALEDLEEGERRIGGSPSTNGQDGRLLRALAHHRLGELPRAREVAGEALAVARAWGAPGGVGLALRVHGLVEGDLDALREAAQRLAASPLRAGHARALAALGAALRRANARAEAREPLREALALARACGADGLAGEIERELEATGARVPRRAGEGADALTPSEARVARMAAEGLANKEIAQALFVTVKTVEMHLGNAFRKLDVGSRRDLPAALGAAQAAR